MTPFVEILRALYLAYFQYVNCKKESIPKQEDYYFLHEILWYLVVHQPSSELKENSEAHVHLADL